MADWQEAFPSRFLRASDIVKAYDATIKTVDYDDVSTEDNKTERKLVATFTEDEHKAIVLNVSRCEALTEIAKTRDYTKWPGTRVNVSQGVTRFGGKSRVHCPRPPDIPF